MLSTAISSEPGPDTTTHRASGCSSRPFRMSAGTSHRGTALSTTIRSGRNSASIPSIRSFVAIRFTVRGTPDLRIWSSISSASVGTGSMTSMRLLSSMLFISCMRPWEDWAFPGSRRRRSPGPIAWSLHRFSRMNPARASARFSAMAKISPAIPRKENMTMLAV